MLIEECRFELDHLHTLLAEFRELNAASRQFLTTAWKHRGEIAALQIRPFYGTSLSAIALKICRDKATENRAFAERVADPRLKRIFLEIAERYDRAGDEQE